MSPVDATQAYLRDNAEVQLAHWEAHGHPDPKLAAQVLYVYASGDVSARVQPGSFRRSLIDTVSRADPENRLKLALGFPELIATVCVVESLPDGVDRLVEALKRRTP